jgi:enoyl-CoA hydratase
MGFCSALNACFTIHELNHAHWAWIHDSRLPMGTAEDVGIGDWRTSPRVWPAAKDLVVAPDPVG